MAMTARHADFVEYPPDRHQGRGFDHAIELANDSLYGLISSLQLERLHLET